MSAAHMFVILHTPHEDIRDQLTDEEINAAVKHLLQGRIDVTEEEYQALKHAIKQQYAVRRSV